MELFFSREIFLTLKVKMMMVDEEKSEVYI